MIVPNSRAAVLPAPVTKEKVLLVEGETPKHFFEAFLKHLSKADSVEIRSYGGIKELPTFLRTLACGTAFRALVRSLGIVRDAEDDPKAAIDSLQGSVKALKLDAKLTVAYYILPDKFTSGMIETLLVRAIEDQPEFPCTTRFFECLNAVGLMLPDGPIIAKNQVQAYLASKADVQMMPGIAATSRGMFPFSHFCFDQLREFLLAL
jgi:hypothetical protein